MDHLTHLLVILELLAASKLVAYQPARSLHAPVLLQQRRLSPCQSRATDWRKREEPYSYPQIAEALDELDGLTLGLAKSNDKVSAHVAGIEPRARFQQGHSRSPGATLHLTIDPFAGGVKCDGHALGTCREESTDIGGIARRHRSTNRYPTMARQLAHRSLSLFQIARADGHLETGTLHFALLKGALNGLNHCVRSKVRPGNTR